MSADDARHPFEEMLGGADSISALPDHLLQEILSMLPAQEAVQTCVLARRWRHLWRSTLGLRLVGRDDVPARARDLRAFVRNLLSLRDRRTEIHAVEIKFGQFWPDDETAVGLWIRYFVMRRVRSLTLHTHYTEFLYLWDMRIASPYLRTLDLVGVSLRGLVPDIPCCPALEDMRIKECDISLNEISSSSLKHLSITGSIFQDRIHVSTPGLVSLKLDDLTGLTPFFENMLLLETASVNLGSRCTDICCHYADSGNFCGAAGNTCENCGGYRNAVLLGGISSARHLELTSEYPNFIFARDLERRPIFRNLKTLLLNEYWCKGPACRRLACILKSSPVLEKLTLVLFSKGPNHKVEMKGSYMKMEGPSAISEHLKIVEVKCNVVDERILKVLKFLHAFNIRFSSE